MCVTDLPQAILNLLCSLLLACWQSRHEWWQHILPVTPTPPCAAAITDQLHINTLAGRLYLRNDACSRVLCGTQHGTAHSSATVRHQATK